MHRREKKITRKLLMGNAEGIETTLNPLAWMGK
jgi:hypothetical protein